MGNEVTRDVDELDDLLGIKPDYKVRNCPYCKREVRFHVFDNEMQEELANRYKEKAQYFMNKFIMLSKEIKELKKSRGLE